MVGFTLLQAEPWSTESQLFEPGLCCAEKASP